MNLIYIAALVAVCSAAKLDRTYLPPASSKTAGGSGDLQTPHFRDPFEPGRNGLPKGAEENEFEGIVVEAAAPGTRQSSSGDSGLGGPRLSYGSTHSKVGEAAFRIKQQQRPDGKTQGTAGQSDSQILQSLQHGALSNFNRPHPGAHLSDSQIPHSFHQGHPSDYNKPRPGFDQSDSKSPQNFYQGAPSDFNRPRPAADHGNSQVSHRFHQGVSPNFVRPRPAADQSNSQAQQNFNLGAPFDFNGSRPTVGQSDSQVSHGLPQVTPSEFNKPRPAADPSDSQTSQSFHEGTKPNFIRQRPQSAFERASNTVRIENNVGSQAYNYAYETENGITAEERGVNINGVQAEGGFSYTGDDGKFYKITYTAGEGGYLPVGDHLPTPPPIPDEIQKSLEQNAKEGAGGSEDDGSYDAVKYNAEDDYTKSDTSNSRQPAFGKKPESDVDVTGTFINQNNRPFESLSQNNDQEPTSIHRFSEQHSLTVNNFTTTQDRTASNDNKLTQNSDKTKFVPSQSEGDTIFIQSGLSESEKNAKPNKQDSEFVSDDYSRPINFGSTQFSQVSGNGFGNKQPNSPTSNYFIHNQATGVQPDTIQTGLSSQRESHGISDSSNFVMKNKNTINQQNIGSHESSQILSHSNKHMTNIEFNRNPNISEQQLSFSPSIPSTLQPSLELSTPYEYSSYSNNDNNVHYQSQNQRGSPVPTQQSFSSQVTPDSQSSIVTNSGFIKSNTDGNSQLSNSNLHQESNLSQQLPFAEQQNFNINSQENPRKEHPYYYNQPSITFNPYTRPTTLTFAPNKSDNRFNSIVPTKYPIPPTVTSGFSSIFPGRNMYNQNSNIPQSVIHHSSGFGSTTKYPQPPSLGHIIPAPTSPISQNGEKYFAPHTGITHASVSPFPSISPSKYNSNYNSQRPETTHQNLSPNSQSTAIQRQTNDKPENQNIPNLSTLGEKTRPSQQYDGEVYEYKKPTETTYTPTVSEESIQQNGFAQFGQKLKPAPTQANSNFNQINKQNQYNKNQKYPSSQGTLSLAGTTPITESQNFQSQINLQATPESNNQEFNKDNRQPIEPFSNTHPIVHGRPTQSSQISPGAFTEVQTTADYNSQFGFSSRIRPCCQGSRKTSIGKTPDSLSGNSFQNSAPIGHQHTNLRPLESSKPFNTQPTGLQNDFQDKPFSTQPTGVQNDLQNKPFNTQSTGLQNDLQDKPFSTQPTGVQYDLQDKLFSTQSTGVQNDFQNKPFSTRPTGLQNNFQTTSQSLFMAKEEEFDGARPPPSFDEASGYHY